MGTGGDRRELAELDKESAPAASGEAEKKKGRDRTLSAPSPGPIGSSDKRFHSQKKETACTISSELAPRRQVLRQQWGVESCPSHPGARQSGRKAQCLPAWSSAASGRVWSLTPQVLREPGGTKPTRLKTFNTKILETPRA